MIHPHHALNNSRPRFWRSRYGIGFLVIGAVVAYFLLEEHRAHLASYLPFLLLAACPLMHFFIHGKHGHGGHGDHAQGSPRPAPDEQPAPHTDAEKKLP